MRSLSALLALLLAPLAAQTALQSKAAGERRSDPMLAMFLQIKKGLTGAGSAAFWDDMKGKAMPTMRGTVVSARPSVNPKVVELAMSQSETTEITLTAPKTSPSCKLDPGTMVRFEGAEGKEFTPNPFMLKLEGGTITTACSELSAPR